jgi:phenylpyruvate tautomerase PptA (4-oxalocrotonate tautomerase family)
MPLVRISVPNGKNAEYLRAISDGIHQALVETFKIPVDDLFGIYIFNSLVRNNS